MTVAFPPAPPVANLLQLGLGSNSVQEWLIAAAAAATVAVGLLGVRRLVVKRFEKRAQETATHVDDLAIGLLRATRLYFVLAIALVVGKQALELPPSVLNIIRWVTVIAVVFQSGRWGNGLIQHWMQDWARKRGHDAGSVTTVRAFGAVARFMLWVTLLLLGLQNVGVNVTTLITGLGITGVAVALAVQNILGDAFAAAAIVIDKPFLVGETINIDGNTGTVERIGLKTTHLRAITGELLVVANADLTRGKLRNFSRQPHRRVIFTLRLSYESPPEALTAVPDMLRQIISAEPRVTFEHSRVARFGDIGVEVDTAYLIATGDFKQYVEIEQGLNATILKRLTETGVRFATPAGRV